MNIRMSETELVEAHEALTTLAAKSEAVAKLREAVLRDLATRRYWRLPDDHPARVDPDYPPERWMMEDGSLPL